MAIVVLFLAQAGRGGDLESLRGTWITTSLVSDGKTLVDPKMPGKDAQPTRWSFEGNRWSVRHGSAIVASGIFHVDPTKTPRTIDILDESGEVNEHTKLGIYRLEGDTYTCCLATPGHPRPVTFSGEAGTGTSLTVSRRDR